MFDKQKQILIVGLGLIGGSYAARLSNLGYKVMGIDIDENAIKFAHENNYINNQNLDNDSLITSSDLIILCLYPNDIIKYIETNMHLFKKGCLITDVLGVKGNLIANIEDLLPKEVSYLSMHPMAGKEVSKIYNADQNLFNNANLIITITDKSKNEDIETLTYLGNIIGFKYIEVMDITKHDKIITFLSQLPHAIAVSLMTYQDVNHFNVYSGDSFRDLTRIAKINQDLWSELFLSNKDNLILEIDNFILQLNELKATLRDNDEEALKSLFIESTKRRKSFDK